MIFRRDRCMPQVLRLLPARREFPRGLGAGRVMMIKNVFHATWTPVRGIRGGVAATVNASTRSSTEYPHATCPHDARRNIHAAPAASPRRVPTEYPRDNRGVVATCPHGISTRRPRRRRDPRRGDCRRAIGPFRAQRRRGRTSIEARRRHDVWSQVPTSRSSFFSIAMVRAAVRRDVRDAFFCGSGHDRSVPLPGPTCLSRCMFNTTCPRLDERDRVSSHLDHFFDPEIPHSQTSSRLLDCMEGE